MTAMTTDSKDEYRFGYSREELERLGYQHRVWVEANQHLLTRARLADGMTVADLGCGPGSRPSIWRGRWVPKGW